MNKFRNSLAICAISVLCSISLVTYARPTTETSINANNEYSTSVAFNEIEGSEIEISEETTSDSAFLLAIPQEVKLEDFWGVYVGSEYTDGTSLVHDNITDGDGITGKIIGLDYYQAPYNSIEYIFDTPKVINRYEIYPEISNAPGTWKLQAWDENSAFNPVEPWMPHSPWVDLDVQTNVTDWTYETGKEFLFSNIKAYTKYRLYFTAPAQENGYVGLTELKMFE